RLLSINAIRRVDDVALDDKFADVMQVTTDRDMLDLLYAPTQLTGNDLCILADALGMALRVLIFAINRGGEGAHGVAVDAAQVVVELPILVRTPFDFAQQPMVVYADTDVPRHRANHFAVFRRERFIGCLAAERDKAHEFAMHDERRNERNAQPQKRRGQLRAELLLQGGLRLCSA